MSVFELAIAWLAPPDCIGCAEEGSVLCELCSGSELLPYGERCFLCGSASALARTCSGCRKSSPRHVWTVTDYAGIGQELLQAYKFGHARHGAGIIASHMTEVLREFNSDLDIEKANYVIVPVPTASSRIRERGFDHALLLAKVVSRQTGLKLRLALGRLGQTRQVGARRTARLAQQADQYFVRRGVKGRNVLLIDDVVTTGATLRAATKTLRRAGAKRVDALVFAKRL